LCLWKIYPAEKRYKFKERIYKPRCVYITKLHNECLRRANGGILSGRRLPGAVVHRTGVVKLSEKGQIVNIF
jgi:hypothetical protein